MEVFPSHAHGNAHGRWTPFTPQSLTAENTLFRPPPREETRSSSRRHPNKVAGTRLSGPWPLAPVVRCSAVQCVTQYCLFHLQTDKPEWYPALLPLTLPPPLLLHKSGSACIL